MELLCHEACEDIAARVFTKRYQGILFSNAQFHQSVEI